MAKIISPGQPWEHPRKLVAVVVPLSDRNWFTSDEQISLKHLSHFLGSYDKYFVVPEGLVIEKKGFRLKPFSKKYFGNVSAHTRLMLSAKFYESFADYRYILIYHLDALVFSDQLVQWCDKGFDYIGAPWIEYEGAPYAGRPGNEGKVGNGGFSLRNISSFLKVLSSPRYTREPDLYWQELYASRPRHIQWLNLHKKVLKHLRVFNGVSWELLRYPYSYNEEYFWTNRAVHYYPEFKIAPLQTALRFAFECGPRICYEKNNRTLPFGCHAWNKYDREFWEPFLLGNEREADHASS